MATLKTFKAAHDEFEVHLIELMAERPKQRDRYSALMGYEYENGLLLASNMRCLMFMKCADRLSAIDLMTKYKVPEMRTHICYKLAISQPFAGRAEHKLNADSLRDAIHNSMRQQREHYNPTVCLPDGLCYNSHYLSTALTFFDEDIIEAHTVPFADPNSGCSENLLLLRNLDKDAFFYICPDMDVDPEDSTRYVEKISKAELSGTLFDLL